MSSKIFTYSFCDNYIDSLRDYIEKTIIAEGKDLSRTAIVFGGKRPALFLKRELARVMGRSFFPPRFFSIDELVCYIIRKHERFSALQDMDSSYLMYQLTQRLAPHVLDGRESFAQFLPWARELLSFIDQLDLEDIQDSGLRNIQDNAQIGYAVPEDINKLLENVVFLREEYHRLLKKDGFYSRGIQYRRAAELVEKTDLSEFDDFLFCNFFYFNKSELAVVRDIHGRGQGSLIFQGDQRKWPVLDRIAKHFDCALVEGDQPTPTEFDLKLYAGFDGHSQVHIVREILKKVSSLDKTVVVLPNADLIVPLLSEITSLVNTFNISMGYPLKRSSLYTLIEYVFKAQLTKKNERYYTRDFLKILRHPFIKNLKFSEDASVTRILIHKLEDILTGKEPTELSGQLFIKSQDILSHEPLYESVAEMLKRMNVNVSQDDLRTVMGKIQDLCFDKWDSMQDFYGLGKVLEEFLNVLLDKSFMEEYPLNINIATKLLDIKDELMNASFNKEVFSKEDLFRILDSKIAREIVAFIGSPLKGLQILGLFETRSLNFDTVIVLDVNEGALPRLNLFEPLIPREVMISLNLDRLGLEEEIQRYQFMRLISSAKDVHLVYKDSKENGRSRFVEELIWDEQKSAETYQDVPVNRASFKVQSDNVPRVYKKTPAMIDMLKGMTFSASSINTYLRNPVDFYFNYVLGLREQEDLLDDPDARHVGTLIHEVLELAYRPYINSKPPFDKAFSKQVQDIFNDHFDDRFGKSMNSDAFLLKSVIAERLHRFFELETEYMENSVSEILFLEKRFEETISMSCGDIRFGYIVDRVDMLKDGTVMIMDYKTGSLDVMPKDVGIVEKCELNRESIFEIVQSFQIPLYFHYLNANYPENPVNAALYNLRTLALKPFLKQKNLVDRDRMNKAFLRPLDFIVSEILDPKIHFSEVELDSIEG